MRGHPGHKRPAGAPGEVPDPGHYALPCIRRALGPGDTRHRPGQPCGVLPLTQETHEGQTPRLELLLEKTAGALWSAAGRGRRDGQTARCVTPARRLCVRGLVAVAAPVRGNGPAGPCPPGCPGPHCEQLSSLQTAAILAGRGGGQGEAGEAGGQGPEFPGRPRRPAQAGATASRPPAPYGAPGAPGAEDRPPASGQPESDALSLQEAPFFLPPCGAGEEPVVSCLSPCPGHQLSPRTRGRAWCGTC